VHRVAVTGRQRDYLKSWFVVSVVRLCWV